MFGLIFKMIIVFVVFEEGVFDVEEIVFCCGFIEVLGNWFYCWKFGGYGNINLYDSLK